jgi:hypothetical protein
MQQESRVDSYKHRGGQSTNKKIDITLVLESFFNILSFGVHKLSKCRFSSNSGISVAARIALSDRVFVSLNRSKIHI